MQRIEKVALTADQGVTHDLGPATEHAHVWIGMKCCINMQLKRISNKKNDTLTGMKNIISLCYILSEMK